MCGAGHVWYDATSWHNYATNIIRTYNVFVAEAVTFCEIDFFSWNSVVYL